MLGFEDIVDVCISIDKYIQRIVRHSSFNYVVGSIYRLYIPWNHKLFIRVWKGTDQIFWLYVLTPDIINSKMRAHVDDNFASNKDWFFIFLHWVYCQFTLLDCVLFGFFDMSHSAFGARTSKFKFKFKFQEIRGSDYEVGGENRQNKTYPLKAGKIHATANYRKETWLIERKSVFVTSKDLGKKVCATRNLV